MNTRIRWPLVGVFAASASGLLLMAVAGGGWTLESWSNALLAIASGLMVLLVGVFVEPRLFRRVEAAVSDAVQAGTAPLAKRVMDLETLAASQAEQRRAMDDEIAAAVVALRAAASRDAVADALRLGEELRGSADRWLLGLPSVAVVDEFGGDDEGGGEGELGGAVLGSAVGVSS